MNGTAARTKGNQVAARMTARRTVGPLENGESMMTDESLRNGKSLRSVKALTNGGPLKNGRSLENSKPLESRERFTWTNPAAPRRRARMALFLPLSLALSMAPASAAAASADGAELLSLQVGETHVLAAPDVARVAVGDSRVLHAAPADGREVLLFARGAGATTLHVWRRNGRRQAYSVDVAPAGLRRIQSEIASLLARIPNARSMVVGERIVIEGEDLADSDQARIAALAQRYPEVVDFTSRVGWDRMVLLDVQVVEVPRSRLREWGVRWDGSSQGGLTGGLAWDAAGSGILSRPGETVLDAAFPARRLAGYFGVNALLSARVNALAQNGEAIILAQPQLLARSGSKASFLAGGEVPYATVDANGNSTTIFKPYGVSLDITPHVERNGTVRSRIEVEVSSVDASVDTPGGPALAIRRAATEFNVRSGQTLVLGGFISREQSRDLTRLPGLGDLPVIGALFGSRRFQQRETELAIFVTPVLVGAGHPDMEARIARGAALVGQAFPDGPVLNTPVRDGPMAAGGWDPYAGPASQWRQPARAAANTYDFKD